MRCEPHPGRVDVSANVWLVSKWLKGTVELEGYACVGELAPVTQLRSILGYGALCTSGHHIF